MAEALVTPNVLTWARHRRGLDTAALAGKLNVKPDAVSDWESGERRPTFRQAKQLAQHLYIPFGYLYLSEPPIEELPIRDFRSMAGRPQMTPSADLLDLLNHMLGKQQWFREYREAEGYEPLSFVGRFKPTDSVNEVAADISDTIDVDNARKQASNFEEFLRQLIRNAENAGIMVMRSGVVGNNNRRPLDVEEFRGFSVSDEIAPLVFINGKDFKGAQIFTFVHELAHVWSGQGGISNPSLALRSELQDTSTERFCDRVAAETLLPGNDMLEQWVTDGSKLESNLKELSIRFKVSEMVALRQAHDVGFLTLAEFREAFDWLVSRARIAEPRGEPGGNFYYTLLARNGLAFTEAVVTSAARGSMLSSRAAGLLGVTVKALPGIAKHLFGSPMNLD